MNGSLRLLLFLLGLICIYASAQNQTKVLTLTSKLRKAIADANSGTKYGSGWVPVLRRALEEVQTRSSRRNFMYPVMIGTVKGFCPPPPEYYNEPCPRLESCPTEKPHNQSDVIVYPDGTFFPWCYPPDCPKICEEPYCYPCVAPHCDKNCRPPDCYPPCKKPCRLPPSCYPPHCPIPCKEPRCVRGSVEGTKDGSCVQPYCPPPRACVPPYCQKLLPPRTKRGQNVRSRTARCPIRDIVDETLW